MKRLVYGGIVILSLSGLLLAQARGRGRGGAEEQQSPVQVTTAPAIPFDSVPDFLKLPEGMNFGEVPGVAVNSKGHVFVFTRSNSAYGPAYGAAAAQLLEFGPKGEFIREVGRQLYGWSLADDARPWERVDPPLPARDGLFRQPTDVAWDSKGSIYITDGYIDSRVAKYDRNGDWVKQWGTKGTGPGQFNTPHSIAIDRMDNIYVGDRGNRRVQVFDTDGNFLRQWTIDVAPDFNTRAVNGSTPRPGSMQGVGAPNSLCIPPNQNEVMFLGESTWPGRVFKVTLNGQVVGVIGKSGRNLKQFSGAHALACPSENEIYVAESSNWRLQKIVLHAMR